MVAVTVTVKHKGKALAPKPPVVMGDDHMKRIGEDIAEPLRATLAAGLDADGNALPPEVRGDGIPGHETGALAASIKARRTKRGRLVVAPDYRAFPYGIYLATGVDKVATLTKAIERKKRLRRVYKTDVDRRQVPRPFMGMNGNTLRKVERANVERFQKWVDGALSTAAAAGATRASFNGSRGSL
jgi:hypothetical protein